MSNFKLLQSLTKFRISAHRFPIERGRYNNTYRHNGICYICNKNLGIEELYFMSCTHILYSIHYNLRLLSNQCLFLYLIACKDINTICIVEKYIHDIIATYTESSLQQNV